MGLVDGQDRRIPAHVRHSMLVGLPLSGQEIRENPQQQGHNTNKVQQHEQILSQGAPLVRGRSEAPSSHEGHSFRITKTLAFWNPCKSHPTKSLQAAVTFRSKVYFVSHRTRRHRLQITRAQQPVPYRIGPHMTRVSLSGSTVERSTRTGRQYGGKEYKNAVNNGTAIVV